MVLLWFIGDSMRVAYYAYKAQPIQFFLGSSVAILIDIAIMCQIFRYRKYDAMVGI